MQEYTRIYDNLLLFLPHLTSSIIVSIPFILLWKANKSLFASLVKRSGDPSKNYAIIVLGQIINGVIATIGFLTILGTLGVDISALVAGLGLTSLAVGFGLKDVASNSLSGLLIILFKPFSLNSYLMINDIQGKVVNIDLRYTTIEDENALHLIPNGVLPAEKISILKNGPNTPPNLEPHKKKVSPWKKKANKEE
jgi:small conductance mechanosensitive channel